MVLGAWPVGGRDNLIRRVCEALESGDGGGLLLTGPSGVGKTTLANRVLRDLPTRTRVIHIRASASMHRMPLGALNPLLCHLEPDAAENPLRVVFALEHFLAASAETPVLILIDNAEELDEMSASVLAQLARVEFVKLLVICETLNRAPEEICELWRDGYLNRFDVPPLTLDGVRQVLGGALDAQVSAAAAHFVWSSSNGHPLYVQAMTQELVECGHLVPDDEGTWVMTSGHPSFGHRFAETAVSRLRRYGPESQKVIELLALTGGLPLACLLDLAEQHFLDTLQEDGLITFDRSDPALARLADRRLARAVRAAVPLGRKHRLLRDRVNHECPEFTEEISWQMEFVGWRVECGSPVPTERLAVAAQEANNRRDPENALWFLRNVPVQDWSAAVALEEAHAHVLSGDSTSAIDILDRAVRTADSLVEWAHLELLRATLIQRHPHRFVERDDILRRVRERLDSDDNHAGLRELYACLTAVEVEAAAFDGRFQDMDRTAAELTLPVNGLDLSWRLRAAAWQAEAAVLQGEQEAGLARLRVITERMLDARADQALWENAQAGIFNALVITGRWAEAAEVVRQWRTLHELPHHYSGIEADLAEGVLHVLAGRGGAALERLTPITSQLTTPDSVFYRARLEAAIGYAHALQGDAFAARVHLTRAKDVGGNPGWCEKHLFDYLYWMGMAIVEGPRPASQKLLEGADENAEKGVCALELIHLTAAVMLGRTELAGRLAQTAQKQQGTFARVAGMYAGALLANCADQLVESAQAALDMEFAPLALSAATMARESAGTSAERETLRKLDRVLFQAESVLHTGTPVEALTPGERRIADLAAQGTPSREIASKLNLSIRTVDGYLNRTYSKLNLSGRAQLRSVLR